MDSCYEVLTAWWRSSPGFWFVVLLSLALGILLAQAIGVWMARKWRRWAICPACGSKQGARPAGERRCTTCGAAFKVNARKQTDLPTRPRLWTYLAVGLVLLFISAPFMAISWSHRRAWDHALLATLVSVLIVGHCVIGLIRHFRRYGPGLLRPRRYTRTRN